MSKTVCTYPMVGAVRKVDDVIGANRVWNTINETQLRFLQYYLQCFPELARIPELQSIASLDADVINAWFAERKLDGVRLNKFPKHGFGTGCVLDVKVKWLVTGTVRDVQLATNQLVPGVFLKDGVSFAKSKRLGDIACITTKNGDNIRMALCDEAPDGLALMEHVAVRAPDYIIPCYDYEGIHFPMVDLDDRPDITWLKGMYTTGADMFSYFIAQALQQTVFKMNQFGAHAKSGVALGVMRGSASRPKPPLVIDGPFLIWIQRPGLSRPFFVAHITPEDMKDPGDLDDM